MAIKRTKNLNNAYPEALFGSLILEQIENKHKHAQLEQRKRELENLIRDEYKQVSKEKTLNSYISYFKKWKKTYPIEFQIQTIVNGKILPQVSILVDSMFHAELKNKILTSGHDLDAIGQELIFDLTSGDETYFKINGKEQRLKPQDILLRDAEGILANILFGPAKRSSITKNTSNVLYFAWSPHNINDEQIIAHLQDILSNIKLVYGPVNAEIKVYSAK